MRKKKTAEPNSLMVDTLFRVAKFINYVTDLHSLLELIMKESKEVMNAEASSLMLYDSEADELFFEVALGEKGEAVKTIRLKIGEGFAGISAKERRTIVVNDVRYDQRHFKHADEVTQFTTRNLIATPMLRGERLIGVLEVLNKQDKKGFSDDDVKVLEFFANQAAIAIENARLIQENLRNERLAAIGQATASLSHYIKNILTSIEGGAALVEMALQNKNLVTVNEIWPVFRRASMRLAELVRQMLDYSKPQAPDLKLTDVNQICREIARANLARAANENIELVLNLDETLPIVLLDPVRIYDAILNLVTNAIEATARVGNQVAIKTRFFAGENALEIEVADNGPGIPDNIRNKIFEPFFSTKGAKGTGLGLAIVKKTVEEHQGTIRCLSSEGKGTSFIIRLPFRK
ncbi:MAG: ATP-binding protein [Candidatus Sumerlaeia bacterium]|nr:ATP-binding protein [Candidatus Sumerlaeia bacterium]